MEAKGRDNHMPHNIEAEQGLLGILLVSPPSIDFVVERIADRYFHAPAHQRIYRAIIALHDRGLMPSPVVLKNQFDRDGDLEEVGGGAYLADLVSSTLSTSNTKAYCETISELYRRRRAIEIFHAGTERMRSIEEGVTVDAIYQEIVECLTGPDMSKECDVISFADASRQTLEWLERMRTGEEISFSTGIEKLDAAIGGLYPEGLYVIGARPRMGKTALAFNNIGRAAEKEIPVLYVSLEMPVRELSLRAFAEESGIPMGILRSKETLTRDQVNRLVAIQGGFQSSRISITEKAGLPMTQIVALARNFRRRHGQLTLIIDHLGLIQRNQKLKSETHKIEEITNGLKTLARDLKIPVVLLSQLNRELEKRADKRPIMSDLRDSGSIEQDADVVLFLHREEVYLQKAPDRGEKEGESQYHGRLLEWETRKAAAKGSAEIIIAKNRQGTESIIDLSFDGIRQVFS